VVTFAGVTLVPLALLLAGLFAIAREDLPGLSETAVAHGVVLLVLVAGVGIALAWHWGKQLLIPILQLRQGAEIISRINLGHRLNIRTGDELEDLAHEFNRMAESLQNAYEELGQRVQDATVNLQEERNRPAAVQVDRGESDQVEQKSFSNNPFEQLEVK
jgi:methyl-accepting chemotaxis protein